MSRIVYFLNLFAIKTIVLDRMYSSNALIIKYPIEKEDSTNLPPGP